MSTAVSLTWCAELVRMDGIPDTPFTSGHEFFNWFDSTAPKQVENPAEESDRDICSPNSCSRGMPKTLDGLKKRMRNICRRIWRQEQLLRKVKISVHGRYGPDTVLESDKEGWMPDMTLTNQTLIKASNQAYSNAAWVVVVPVLSNSQPFGPVGINRSEKEWVQQEQIVRRIQRIYLTAHLHPG